MKRNALSHQDTIKVLEIINDSLSCRTEEQLKKLMGRLRDLIPYQAQLAALGSLDEQGNVSDLKVVNVDYPNEYLAELAKQELVMKDPVVVENFRGFHLQYWADTFNRSGAQKDLAKILSLAEDFGFEKVVKGEGYAHGVRPLREKRGSFFCWHGLERSERTESILQILVPHFHEVLSRLDLPGTHLDSLTDREQEVLRWLAQGKTSWDISMILGISERTVKFHVKNLLQKLDAATRAHAVAIGIHEGLMNVE